MRILLVKLSSLGDVVHAMPALQDIRAALPLARVDWVVERAFAPLVARCEGVERVVACDLRRWRGAPLAAGTRREWRAFRTELRTTSYDAVLDLQGLSKSALVAHMARLAPHGIRYALANRTDGSSWEAPTRWVADVAVPVPARSHAVERSRTLCAAALGIALPQSVPRYRLRTVAGAPVVDQRPRIALVHGTSRADKQWPLAHWVELGQHLGNAGFSVALPHGNDDEQRRSEAIAHALGGATNAQVWPRLPLDALLDALAGCAGVIGVDSGLSHLAVALDLPHVQLYNHDSAWRTGPRACALRQRAVCGAPAPTVAQVWQAWTAVSAPAAAPRAAALAAEEKQ